MQPAPQKRGFAAMDPQKLREISKIGGQTAHKLGVAHQWNSATARKAAKKTRKKRKTAR